MRERLGFVFPGQGSQRVGMAQEFYGTRPDQVAKLFDRADLLLRNWGWKRSLRDVCFSGPQELLDETSITQPAIFTTSVAVNEVLRLEGVIPNIISGHSAGMYAGYVASGVLSFEDGLRLITRRGELMKEAGESHPGRMAAIFGFSVEEVERMIADLEVDIAGHNGPEQTVVSGEIPAIDAAIQLFGERRAKLLAVSIAAHSRVMRGVNQEFAQEVRSTDFADPKISIVVDTAGEIINDPSKIKEQAVNQLTERVRWVDTVSTMTGAGVNIFAEVGPGNALSNLIGRIESGAQTFGIQDEESLDRFLSSFGRR